MNISIKDVLYKIRTFFVPYLVVLMLCLLIKFLFSREQIYFAVNNRNFPLGDFIAPYVTDLGNFWTVVVLTLILLTFSYAKAFLLLLINAITAIVAQIVKHIFDAPRPKLYFQNQFPHIHFVKGVDMLMLHSFPSGHTVSAFTTAVLFTYWAKNKFWGFPLLILAIGVGYSRMYLSEHFFEDVTAGSAIGTITTVCLITWLANKQFLKSAKWNKGLIIKG
ncbi:MAG: phosphatase PAP2 family protein [Sphingobacteriales bacterium]